LVNPEGSGRIACHEIIPDRGTVLLCLWRPDNFHEWAARRAAKAASTSSFERPNPSAIDARATNLALQEGVMLALCPLLLDERAHKFANNLRGRAMGLLQLRP
jgi:hypothetical protein